MHITVVPASPKTGQAAIRSLLADPSGPSVKGVYRDLSRVPAEFKANPRFEAVQGNVEDASSLDFAGSDAVLNITPPLYDEQDIIAHARLVSENVKAAVEAAGCRRLVLLSSVGAQYDHGTGEILTNHEAEVILKDAAPEVVFVRCSYFMENWATAVETVRQEGFLFTTLTPLDLPLAMVAIRDIGSTCAAELLAAGTPLPSGSSPFVFELHGPRPYTSVDVQRAFGAAAGKAVELRPVERAALGDFYGAVFPPRVAEHFVEMNESYLEGGILRRDPEPTGVVRHGATELADAVREMYGA